MGEKLTYERKRGEGEFSRLQMRGIAAGFAERSSASRAGDGRRSGRPLRRRYGGAPIGTPLVLHLLWNFMKIYINFLLASGKSVKKREGSESRTHYYGSANLDPSKKIPDLEHAFLHGPSLLIVCTQKE